MRSWFPILALVSGSCFAQQDSITPYFREFKDKISARVFLLKNSNDFMIRSDGQNAEFVPNFKSTLNIGIQYDIVSFSFGYAPRILAENRNNDGSAMRTFSLDFFPGKWVQRLEYHDQKGMTLRPDGFLSGVYLRNFRSVRVGGSTSYFFNSNFSYQAMALQNVQQLRSAGSLSLGLNYHYTGLIGEKEPEVGTNTRFYDLSLAPGYHYNWIIDEHFNVAGGISLGYGINVTNDAGHTTVSSLYTSSLMLAPGYNSDRWFYGFGFRAYYADRKIGNNVSVGDTMSYLTLFLGYRFDAPGFLTSRTQKLKDSLKKKQ